MSLGKLHAALLDAHGPQHWWPAETPFEVMVGAVLTQNTAWSNVRRAIANLKSDACLDARRIADAPHAELARRLEPAGYFNVKAKRLQAYCRWYLEQGGLEALRRVPTAELRAALLGVHGVGPETADDILLYAFERPVFVIDAYTRRILARLGWARGDEPYDALRLRCEAALKRGLTDHGARVPRYNEFHALIVRHGAEVCRPRPRCDACCLAARCPAAIRRAA